MQQSCTYGSVRGALGNQRLYRDPSGRIECWAYDPNLRAMPGATVDVNARHHLKKRAAPFVEVDGHGLTPGR